MPRSISEPLPCYAAGYPYKEKNDRKMALADRVPIIWIYDRKLQEVQFCKQLVKASTGL